MKKIYTISAVTIVCILLLYAGICIANRGNIKIAYSVNQKQSKFTAVYPSDVSDVVINHVNLWASQAAQKSGKLSDNMRLKFSNGISCRVHAEERNLEIIADCSENNATSLASLKEECNAINALILAKAK